jgi:predicted P-loop ATPase
LLNDRKITVTIGASRKSTVWKPESLLLSEFWARLGNVHRGTETLAQYRDMPKSKQDELKDVGGFVAGTFKGEKRRACDVTGRDIVTLDLDNIPAGQTEAVLQRLESLGVGYCVYSTRKHSPEAPRLRVLIPLSRTVTADEYEPIARKCGEIVGLEMCDKTTFEAARLMYFPSCCADSYFVYRYADKPLADADGLLAMYTDWHDVTSWAGLTEQTVPRGKTQKDPTEKTGTVGAFCRVYDIPAVIEAYLPDRYTEAGAGRYTFTGGSTTGGAVLYEGGKFLFSHHATDPAGGRLVNAFDLVRLHLFGQLDDGAKPDTPTNKLPSYAEMCRTAAQDVKVRELICAERHELAVSAFGGENTAGAEGSEWTKALKINEKGNFVSSAENVLLILENDPNLKSAAMFDEFSNRIYVVGKLPWDKSGRHRDWKDTDDAGLRCYLEMVYKISGVTKIYDGFTLYCELHKVNLVKEYLNGLPAWDGVCRLDTLFIDYLGAEDTPYVRAVARKSLCAAVARAMHPGIKYDTMPILAGPQGIGKSTLLRLLGADWFNDSLTVFTGKEASEMLQGSWIVEVGELVGISRAEENQVKQFLSRVEDIFREAYGRRTGRYPRRCVFFGTSNEYEFLRDRTGGRRFFPIDCMKRQPTKSVFIQLADEVPQIWAEALAMWRLGEPLYMENEELASAAKAAQEEHAFALPREGLIREFLERQVPEDWQKRSLDERRIFWSGGFRTEQTALIPRDRVCAMEVWCEALNGDPKQLKRADALEINSVIESLPEWTKAKNALKYGSAYGAQKGFVRQPKG